MVLLGRTIFLLLVVPALGAVGVSPNPHWLEYQGKPILLVGDSITQGWMELGQNFDQKAYLQALGRRGITCFVVEGRLSAPNGLGIVEQFKYLRAHTRSRTMGFVANPAGAVRTMRSRSDQDCGTRLIAINDHINTARDDWHLGAPKIKKVVARIIPDATTRVLEMRKGTINFEINAIPNDSVAEFEKSPDFKVIRSSGSVYQYIAINLHDRTVTTPSASPMASEAFVIRFMTTCCTWPTSTLAAGRASSQ